MNTMTYDTLAASKRMKALGIPQEQAEVLAEEIRLAREVDLSALATKADMMEVKSEIMKWMFGGFLAVIGLLVGILLKLV